MEYVGVDVHTKESQICLLSEGGESPSRHCPSHTPSCRACPVPRPPPYAGRVLQPAADRVGPPPGGQRARAGAALTRKRDP